MRTQVITVPVTRLDLLQVPDASPSAVQAGGCRRNSVNPESSARAAPVVYVRRRPLV